MHLKTLIFAIVAASSLLAQSTTHYHVTQAYTLGENGGWDYIIPDPATHRLYVARETRLMVVNEESGKLVGEVAGINGAHGTAIAAKSGHGFATAGEDKAVVMFDLKTLKALSKIPAADDADAILFDDVSNRVFTLNGDANSSTVIDATTGKLITNIPLKGKPEYGVSAGDGKVFANLVDTNEIVEIDATRAIVTRRWPTIPCKQPVSMAIDKANHRLFSGCRSGVLAVSDSTAGKLITTVPIGAGVDGAAYDPENRDIFVSNADGTLTVIHQESPDKYQVAQILTTPIGSRNLGLNPVNHRLYVASAKFGILPSGSKGKKPVLPGTFTLLRIESSPTVH
jgi:DNA-binding beta-propeller fold protein YncE